MLTVSLRANKCIITYGLDDEENKFIDFIKVNDISFSHIVVRKSMVNMKIKSIINKNNSNYNSNDSSDEKVILFNEIAEVELSALMNLIKGKFDEIPIFAVVTETSSEWTFDYLIDHLIQEREWFKKQQKSKK
ncbi:DUF3783 domain-containing protein [Clostridium sp. LBM24168]